ncbi:MAG: ATP-binding cassette domain-containing protein [Deltaproteobacteria bacterium]|nr:ATP-binding cassette domain-containing protein [Deltaproteobacteria bacterium]
MIVLENIHKKFSEKTVLFERVSLTINPKTINIVTGLSGSGKTTLLKLIRGEIIPDAGTVKIAGKDVSRLRSASKKRLFRSVSMVYQEGKLIDERTVIENIALPLRINGIHGAKLRERVYELLEKFDLEEKAFVSCGVLSGGERRYVSIARAIAFSPSVLLLDEPLNGLDSKSRGKLTDFLCNINETEDLTVLWATHDLSELSKYPDPYIYEIKDKKVKLSRNEIDTTDCWL